MLRKSFILSGMLFLALGLLAMAGEKAEVRTFKGTLSCASCELKKDGASAQCRTYGHRHTLKTDDGQYISFLENDNSIDLIKGGNWHNAKVKVSGTYYGQANLLDVDSFTVEGKSYSWCEGHKKMDTCQSGAGKMTGK
jgi:hypothetical protein